MAQGFTTGIPVPLPVNKGGTGVVTSTGTGNAVLSTSPTLVTPALGTPSAGILTNCTSIPVANATGVLAVANGGTGVTSSKAVIQRVYTQTGAVATGTTTIPGDDTIPQNTEGTEFMTLAITPTSASSLLQVEVRAYCTSNLASANAIIAALFRDSTASALASVHITAHTTSYAVQLVMSYTVEAGSTSATTFKVRIGPNAASTITFNGVGGARIFGGVIPSGISITELSA